MIRALALGGASVELSKGKEDKVSSHTEKTGAEEGMFNCVFFQFDGNIFHLDHRFEFQVLGWN